MPQAKPPRPLLAPARRLAPLLALLALLLGASPLAAQPAAALLPADSLAAAALAAPAPPLDLRAADVPNDNGRAIAISWLRSPDDDGSGRVTGYQIFRADAFADEQPDSLAWQRVGQRGATGGRDERASFTDAGRAIETGRPYRYRVDAIGPGGHGVAQLAAPAAARAQWFNRGRWNMLVAVLLICGAIFYWIQRARSTDITLRPVAGLAAFDEAVGRATEMGQPVLFIPGIQDLDQIETLAGGNILGYVA
ncbi:fibronectin type III domain-containing protein, partial [bacterium]|nr:fibronectin type III domain-containing protein [bacterium]